MKMINFDRQKLKELKNLYNKAVKDNKESFIYNGDEYLTSYAKYVIEYLETKLKPA
jgi:hypothetical protein